MFVHSGGAGAGGAGAGGRHGPAGKHGGDPSGHPGSAPHAQTLGPERRPGEDPAREPAAAGEAKRTPALALLHLPPPFPPELATTAPSHAAQQQHPQTEALHRRTHMVSNQTAVIISNHGMPVKVMSYLLFFISVLLISPKSHRDIFFLIQTQRKDAQFLLNWF